MADELDQRFRQPVAVVLEEARRRGDVTVFVVLGLAVLVPIGGGIALDYIGVPGPAGGFGMWVGMGGGLAALLGLGALVWGAVRTQSKLPAVNWLTTVYIVLILMDDVVRYLETEPGPIYALSHAAMWALIWGSAGASLRARWQADHARLALARLVAWGVLGAGVFGPWVFGLGWLTAPWVWLWPPGLVAFATVGTLMKRLDPARGGWCWSGPVPPPLFAPPSVAEEVRRLRRRSDVVVVLGGLFFLVVGVGSLAADILFDVDVVEPMTALVISGVVVVTVTVHSAMLDERVRRLTDKYRGRGTASRKDQQPKKR